MIVPILKGKGDAMSCRAYGGVIQLEHAMKIAGRILIKRSQKMVKINAIQFGFVPGKGTIDAMFVMRRLEEEY